MDAEQAASVIGPRLVQARAQRGWTLTEAAASIGVSVPHLSRMEKGERQPSVAVLIAVARAYAVSVGRLVGEDGPAHVDVFRGAAVPTHSGSEGRYAGLSGSVGQRLLEAFRLELAPATGTSKGAKHAGEEWLFVVSGACRLDIEEEGIDLQTGDAVHFDAQRAHSLWNGGTEFATVLIVSANAQGGAGGHDGRHLPSGAGRSIG